MSAENAWRIALDAVANGRSPNIRHFILKTPMPPAFRAAVEAEKDIIRNDRDAVIEMGEGSVAVAKSYQAEAEELRGMLAEVTSIRNLADLFAAKNKARALLSRLEAKEEVSLRPLPDAAFEPRPAGWGEGGKGHE